MGTALEITLFARDRASGRAALDRLFAIAEQLDQMLSTYRDSSALSRVNRAAGSPPTPVPPDLTAILREALAYSEQSRGAFDATIGPLVDLWTRAARRDRPPSDGERSQARRHVGAHQILLVDNRAALRDAAAHINLGAIAKGYALDRMREALESDPALDSAFASFGQSSTLAWRAPPQTNGWRLLLRDGEGLAGTIALRDQALSVSGSLGQWSEIGGRRYGHVIDPRTGHALTQARQASALASSASAADAWSTALLVLGESEGIALIEAQPGVEAQLIDPDGRRWSTSGFERATRFEALGEAP